jgi:RHS repeat-associated protein
VTPTATNTPRFVRTIIFKTGYPIPSTPTYQIESIPETQEVQQQEEPQMLLSMLQVDTLAEYIYDGDGNLVQSIIAGVVTYYPNQYYEKRVNGETESILKYYYAAGKRIAMRQDGAVTFLLADHLGSTSVTTDSTGVLVSSMLYTAFGETRSSYGSPASDYRYTGQREESEIGLYFYNARFYDAALARFISADTIVPQPGDPLAWDRYAYVRNNPIKYNDPSGHWVETVLDIAFIAYDIYDIKTNGLNWVNGLSLVADIAGTVIPVVTGAGLAVKAIAHADESVKVINAVDNSLDLAKALENTTSMVDKIEDLSKAASIPLENHHFATNKNKTFTPLFEELVKKYGLDLNGEWNIFKMPHKGRHPNDYHRWVLDNMKEISKSLDGCKINCSEEFINLFIDKVVTPVRNNPEMLRKIFWKTE